MSISTQNSGDTGEQTKRGQIITFYSYKGGTGRSMALANTACILAERLAGNESNGILMVDWDLEAPGLHRYFRRKFLASKAIDEGSGLIDLFYDLDRKVDLYIEGNRDNSQSLATEQAARDVVKQIDLSRYVLPTTIPNLSLLKAGRFASADPNEYSERVNKFAWEALFKKSPHLIRVLGEALAKEYSYVLIDSRTGITDISGISTMLLPEKLVVVFTPNLQSLKGGVELMRKAADYRKESVDLRPLSIFPLVSRVEASEPELRHDWRFGNEDTVGYQKEFETALTSIYAEQVSLNKYFDDLQIQHIPRYAYGEEIAVLEERTSDKFSLRRSYYSFAMKLIAQDPSWEGEIDELSDQDPNVVAENALSRLPKEDLNRARRIVERLVKLESNSRLQLPLQEFPLNDERIIQELVAGNLLTIGTGGELGKGLVQLAHDKFLTSWSRLHEWLREEDKEDDQTERRFLLWVEQLRPKKNHWKLATLGLDATTDGGGTDPNTLLLKADELSVAQEWLKKKYDDIYADEREFIQASGKKSTAPSPIISDQIPLEYFNIPYRDSDNVAKAQQILRGKQEDPRRMLELAKSLKAELRFSYARRLLARASVHETISIDKRLREIILQQLALCTYKDEDLPADDRLDRALGILHQVADFETTKNQETLGLIASVYKRKWEIDNQRQNLERALFYYLRGYEEGPVNDQGYTGINAAFVLDRLAALEEGEAERASKSSKAAEERRQKAREIRLHIVEQVGALINDPSHRWIADKWWYYATMAEAQFGLQNYEEAVRWIRDGQAAAGQIFEWELETCARQLATLARLQIGQELQTADLRFTPAYAALERAFGADAIPRTAFTGKIGLALSGGGFRASLYHLGVLARLAELDVLRSVEVLSCVSGGSILGAYYYLKVRSLLQTKTNAEINREDYIKIVHEMIDEFLAGVQQNIRTRVAVNPLRNFRMFWSRNYSRTTRVAELYEKHLYSRVLNKNGAGKLLLNECKIYPWTKTAAGECFLDRTFSPKYQNWRRDAKVPILVLNAATLNTGHTWQFTASWMGEAPAGIDSEIDGNDRLRRMYYEEAPKLYQQMSLGAAVGASAAVPGLFEPLSFDYLYPERIVRLVDGGVCDNQGVASLLEQDCKVILVSDASGQMESQLAVSKGVFGVLLRTNNVFQARIREAEYHDLKGRRRSGLLRGLMFVHLKGDLEVDPIDWINCLDPFDASDDARPASRRGPFTRYGIAKDIQELLSGIRTDLDSFSEAEAYALMTSAYRMTEYQFKYENCVEGFDEPEQAEPWKFLAIESCMMGVGGGYEYLRTLLRAGSSLAFKVWQIDPFLKYTLRIFLVLVAVSLGFTIYTWWDQPLPPFIAQYGNDGLGWVAQAVDHFLRSLTFKRVVTWLLGLYSAYLTVRILQSVLGDYLADKVIILVRWKDTLRRIAIATFVSTLGFVAAVAHVYFFDRRFLKLGSMAVVNKKNSDA
jgi:predicted acylesterase/phospholipase RssA/MinD-like ATPase involved in chromosome partitioning or flagellar assembly